MVLSLDDSENLGIDELRGSMVWIVEEPRPKHLGPRRVEEHLTQDAGVNHDHWATAP